MTKSFLGPVLLCLSCIISIALASPKPTAQRERECDGQFQADTRTCNSLKKVDARSRCHSSATLRLGMCLRKQSLPPLVTW